MRAIVITQPGGPEVLETAERPLPEPSHGQVRVQVQASGVNRADLLQRRGLYPAPRGWPQEIPGLEFSGTVDAIGPNVDGWEPGVRVMGILGGGAYAEYVVTDADTLIAVPDALDLTTAAAVPEAFLTAYDAMILQCGLIQGEHVLIHAVGSGVGTAAVQIAAGQGARTLGTSRTASKLERAVDLGLDVAIRGDAAWADTVLLATDGYGVDVILDLVGGVYLESNLEILAERGRMIAVGVPGGSTGVLDLRQLMRRRASVRGTVLRARPTHEKAELAVGFTRDLLPALADGRLHPVLDRVLPAASAAEAHALLEANVTFGKVLLRWR